MGGPDGWGAQIFRAVHQPTPTPRHKAAASLKETADKDREFLEQSSDKLVAALGDAAKKTMPNVTATATSTTKSDSNTPAQAPTMVMAPAPVVVNGAPPMPAAAQRAPAAAACAVKHPHPVKADCEKAADPLAPADAHPATASAAPAPKAG